MRLWHHGLFPYLPDLQFKGQLREVVAIMRDWRDKGSTNHLLINKVMEYERGDLVAYFALYEEEFQKRYGARHENALCEFEGFLRDGPIVYPPFVGWHNYEYLRVCMANLYEKHQFGVGKSRITDEEWERLLFGYNRLTGEEYEI